MGKLSRSEKKLKREENRLLAIRETCVNCEQPLALDQRFCANCGGKRIYNRLTWRNLFTDFADRFLNLENSFFKTFVALFRTPEDVIGGYMKGMRKKYLPAFSYFAIALTVAGIYAFILKTWFVDDMIEAQVALYDGSPQEAFQKDFAAKYTRFMLEHQSLFYFAMIPFLALLSKIVFWNYKNVNLVEHFVIYLYGYSHVAMVSAVLMLCLMWSSNLLTIYSFISIILMIVYMGFVLKRVFKLDGGQIVLKTGLFALVGLGFFLLIGIAAGISGYYMARSGAFDDTEFMKNIKAQNTKELQDASSIDTISNTTPPVKDTLQ